jgi:hypothetical protein
VGGQGEGGSGSGTSMASVTGNGNGEGEAIGCGHLWRGRGGGGEATLPPLCWRGTTQQRGARRSGRPKAAADSWRSKMTKRNWVNGLNVRLDRTAD